MVKSMTGYGLVFSCVKPCKLLSFHPISWGNMSASPFIPQYLVSVKHIIILHIVMITDGFLLMAPGFSA